MPHEVSSWALSAVRLDTHMLIVTSGGKNASLPAAIVCGSAAGVGHVLDDRLQPFAIFQQWLVDNDLMDKPGGPAVICIQTQFAAPG